jgi:hypothetical protein
MPTVVHQKLEEVESRLPQLGLTRDILIEIVQACVAGYAGCTDNDPPGGDTASVEAANCFDRSAGSKTIPAAMQPV